MSIQFLSASTHYLKLENFAIESNFPATLNEFLSKHQIEFNERYQDIALRCSISEVLIPSMQKLFEQQFICHYLSSIFSDEHLLNESREKHPYYIFINSKRKEFLEFKYNGKIIKIGNKKEFHREVSALADALGLNLNERDN